MTFKPGQSGNPAGKPKGAGDKRLEIRKSLEVHSSALISKLIKMALDGDVQAMKIIFERISPKPKSESVNLEVDINAINTQEDLRLIAEKMVIKSMSGDIPDDQAKVISELIKFLHAIDTRIKDDKRIDSESLM